MRSTDKLIEKLGVIISYNSKESDGQIVIGPDENDEYEYFNYNYTAWSPGVRPKKLPKSNDKIKVFLHKGCVVKIVIL